MKKYFLLLDAYSSQLRIMLKKPLIMWKSQMRMTHVPSTVWKGGMSYPRDIGPHSK